MRNSLLLITLGTVLFLSTSTPLQAQAAPPATAIPTNQPTASGVLASPVVFEWKSGSLHEFLSQIKNVFGIDLNQRADIPGEMRYARVPAMKVSTAKVWDVLDLYNSISDEYPGIGRWVIKRVAYGVEAPNPLENIGSPSQQRKLRIIEPNAIFLVPSRQKNTEESFSVRAFTLRDIKGQEQKQLFELINVERDRLRNLAAEGGINPGLINGDVHFHEDTGICVATGGKTYVEMVGSLIDAFREGRHTGSAPRPYSTKPQDDK